MDDHQEITKLVEDCRRLGEDLNTKLERLSELTGEHRPDYAHRDDMTVGERIRWLRGELGWSQDELAAQAGMSVTGLVNIETGYTTTPRVTTITKIARAFGIDPTTLREGDAWVS